MNRTIVGVESDTHGNCKLGLLNPNTELVEEDESGNTYWHKPELNRFQEFLWELRNENLNKLDEFAAGDDVVAMHLGDMAHGNKYVSRLVSDRPGDQYVIACDNFAPWFDRELKAMRIVAGTGAHNFGFGSVETVVTRMLKEQFPNVDIAMVNHGLLSIDGASIDYAHHGPSPGIRDWTKGNVARHYLRSLINCDIKEGKRPPRIVLRGHFHQYCRETLHVRFNGEWITCDLFILPAYCGMDDFGRQATRSRAYQYQGMLALELMDGELARVKPFIEVLDVRTEEDL